MTLRKLLHYGFILMLLGVACGQPAEQFGSTSKTTTGRIMELNIYAAASLTESFGEIGKNFESEHPGVRVILNFGGSQQLAQQLDNGAPGDVFASANQKQMDAVIQSGRILTGTTQLFAQNRLVVIYPASNPAGINRLEDLAKPGLHLVLAAKEVPVGQYSLQFFDNAGQDPAFDEAFRQRVTQNVVSYEENVKAVLSKVAFGEADAGIVYTSDISADTASKIKQIDIPDALNVIASYPIARIKDSANPDLAQAFVSFVLSSQGQVILAKYGFIPAGR